MPTFTKLQLTEDFKQHFGITDVHASFDGGQKKVFIVSRKGSKVALKIFINYGDREIRELKIYTEFEKTMYVPKIIEQADYEKDKVVFETYIEGDNLDSIGHKFKNDEASVRNLLKQLIAILTPFWNRDPSIVHRDIKPSNIIISTDGQAHVIDFGIARILGEDSITDTTAPQPGSWKFAAPEQYSGKKDLISYRTDFFSLSVLAYFLFYGTLPFGNTIEKIAAAYNMNPLNFSVTECGLKNFFNGCFRIAPAERPRNTDKLLSLLE
ncbi:MAG TPA: protein kinase [Chryseosolibacter sp.]|nr:protein kinase [Chryseosolibacter sp.]